MLQNFHILKFVIILVTKWPSKKECVTYLLTIDDEVTQTKIV